MFLCIGIKVQNHESTIPPYSANIADLYWMSGALSICGVQMLDREGFRPNVGIVLINLHDEVLLAQRARPDHGWQFPQGGIDPGESPDDAMYRELHEEIGLLPEPVRMIGRTRDWLRYEVPAP